jgi:hypothetical protein
MSTNSRSDGTDFTTARTTRRRFLQTTFAVGAGTALAGAATPFGVLADAPPANAAGAVCTESVQDILNLAYTVERAATTFYYTGLTSKSVLRDHRLAGSAANPNAVGPDGNAANVANLQAALDQEQKHAQILANLGAASSFAHFYFPASAFASLGYTSHAGTFLWLLDHLETACIAIYLAAIRRFGELRRPDLAVLSVRNLAVESEHRALYRAIAGDDPADNVTVPVAQFACTADALGVLTPYLTGQGFPHGVTVTRAIGVPTSVQTARVIGRYTSS